jgi:hypothetical protein
VTNCCCVKICLKTYPIVTRIAYSEKQHMTTQKLVFYQVCLFKLGEDLHGVMDRVGRPYRSSRSLFAHLFTKYNMILYQQDTRTYLCPQRGFWTLKVVRGTRSRCCTGLANPNRLTVKHYYNTHGTSEFWASWRVVRKNQGHLSPHA